MVKIADNKIADW